MRRVFLPDLVVQQELFGGEVCALWAREVCGWVRDADSARPGLRPKTFTEKAENLMSSTEAL
jgi:hypothetical protein